MAAIAVPGNVKDKAWFVLYNKTIIVPCGNDSTATKTVWCVEQFSHQTDAMAWIKEQCMGTRSGKQFFVDDFALIEGERIHLEMTIGIACKT